MILVTHTLFAQYPTKKNIGGQYFVIMTEQQAREIDIRFEELMDSIKHYDSDTKSLEMSLNKTRSLLMTKQDSLKKTIKLNNTYYNEIQKYKKMEFEDKKVKKRVTLGISAALIIWTSLFISSFVN